MSIRIPLFRLAALALLIVLPGVALSQAPAPALAARAWLLHDVSAGQTLVAQNADDRVEPASLTKLMTAYLVFTALKEKRLTLEQVIPVSERAWRAGGSRMFIDPRKPVTVGELIQGMIIQSGNDACIALAEAIAGSEQAFVQMMNREAKRLGMQVLVTDHHLPGAKLPDADALVNPNQPGCGFASKHLAGVGVMFYVLLALRACLRERGVFAHAQIGRAHV